MSDQLTRDAISDAMDGNILHHAHESAISTIAAGYGNVLTIDRKTSEEQDSLIFNQHDGAIDAALNKMITKQENKQSAEAFTQYAENPKERDQLLKNHPELENATELYKQGENHLTKNGQLSLDELDNLDRRALKIAVEKIAEKIEEQGPELFGKVTITNEQLKPSEHEVSR